MVTLVCKISDDLDAQLKAESARRHLSKSALVHEALERSLRHYKGSHRQTAFDLVKNLCGIIKSGSMNMSTNAKYGKDFGV